MNENNNKSSNTKPSKKKWLILGVVGTALLLIPRRSSRQVVTYADDLNKESDKKTQANRIQ